MNHQMLHPGREFLRLLPKVLRARDFHLYLENGKRLVDLWLDGGRAILGHKAPRLVLELKNAAERGLFTALPHPAERRFIKALEEIFPGRAFRLYMGTASLSRALEEAGFPPDGGNVSLWRPFLPPAFSDAGDRSDDTGGKGIASRAKGKPSIIIPVLPCSLGPEVLVLEKALDASFPVGELIPPVLLAPATRALYNLAAALKAPGQGRMQYSKVNKLLKMQKTGGSGSLWSRQGIYLTVEADMQMEKYEPLFRRFLEGGFLIPPSPAEPAILPAAMSKGEEAKLAELLLENL